MHTKEGWIFFTGLLPVFCIMYCTVLSFRVNGNVYKLSRKCSDSELTKHLKKYFSYSVTVKHHTHSSALKLTIRTNVVTCVTLWWCLLICCLNSRKICPLRCHSAWLVICMTRKPHDRKCLTAWKSCCVEICVCLGFSEDTTHFHHYFNTFIAEKIIIHLVMFC